MITRICTLLIILTTSMVYSQNITLLKNFNPKVKALNHKLSINKDSLDLSCECKIMKVDIFNEDYDQTFEIKDFQTLISLRDIPEGEFVVEVYLEDKIVLMHIVKQKPFDVLTEDKKKVVEAQGMMLDEKMQVIKSTPNQSIEFLLSGNKVERHPPKKKKFYWVVKKSNTEIAANQSMKLVDLETVNELISINKKELSTEIGKNNKLIIYEVYNSSKFMRHQLKNPSYFKSSNSEVFNVKPIYDSLN
ncbi:hypothetical protein [Winogradskyella sp.]|uniref:hypothetical protein n=1 Tax=Winogradskyella sp. TaxID=1883156 RepID=UPI00262D627A|nr:hypothetical protein [Winogradskyella sp.]